MAPGEHTKLKKRELAQYYYFYGSTSEGGASLDSPVTATDQDSLVGESLIPTDNEHEEETPRNSAHDLQHLVIMKGNGVHVIDEEDEQQYGIFWRKFSLRRLRRNHPIAYISLVICAVTIFFFVFAVVIFPNGKAGSSANMPRSDLSFRVPFLEVDRAQFDDPVSTFLDKSLFDPKLFYKGPKSSREFVFPFPTGAFWTNLVLPPTADRGISYPVAVYPYAYKWSDELLQLSYPAIHRSELPKEIHDYFFPDLTFGTSETNAMRYVTSFDPLSVTLRFTTNNGGFWETYLVQGSPYATIVYNKASPVIRALSTFTDITCPRDDANGLLTGNLSNRRRRLLFGICSTSDDSDHKTTTAEGVQFILKTQEGLNWIVFASEPITLVFDRLARITVASPSQYQGVLRVAIIPPPAAGVTAMKTNSSDTANAQLVSKGLQRLIYHAGVYPVGGDFSWSVRQNGEDSSLAMAAHSITGLESLSSRESFSSSAAGRIATIRFQFATETFTKQTSAVKPKALLMLALPHHAQSLPLNMQLGSDQFDLVYKCIKGPMRPVLGSTWAYDEVLPTLGFDGDQGSNSDKNYLNPHVQSLLLESLQQDIKLALPTATENIYGFGKQSARLAQLVYIASKLIGNSMQVSSKNESTVASPLTELFDNAMHLLRNALEHLLTSNVSDTLVYDSNLGGMVTTDGLRDPGGDFGNGRYNDHHFHYGYILYACAIMGKLDQSFLTRFRDQVDSIYFDVAYDANFGSQPSDGVFFPGARHKSWFDGHSFASGLFPFGNGKSQESSSEAVNCYYGAYLWSLVRHGAAADPSSDTSEQTDFARILLATELRGAKTYWHMQPPLSELNQTTAAPSVYSAQFSQNYMVGNLGMLDAVCSTWFGTSSLYVHMINFIPVTAVTGELFPATFVQREYKNVLQGFGDVEMAWRGYVTSDHAIIDPNKAFVEAQELFSPELDSGLSKTQVLYWIVTRNGFQPPNASDTSSTSPAPHATSATKSLAPSSTSSCLNHPQCKAVGLTGNCCPTDDGVALDCCTIN